MPDPQADPAEYLRDLQREAKAVRRRAGVVVTMAARLLEQLETNDRQPEEGTRKHERHRRHTD